MIGLAQMAPELETREEQADEKRKRATPIIYTREMMLSNIQVERNKKKREKTQKPHIVIL